MIRKNHAFASVCIVSLLLAGCFSSRDYTVYGHHADHLDGKFSIDEDLEVFYCFRHWGFTYDGLSYVKCKGVEESSVSGPWEKGKSPTLESFLKDFYALYYNWYASKDSPYIRVGQGLPREEYEISLDGITEYWYYYAAFEAELIDGKSTYVTKIDLDNYLKYDHYTCYCYVPSTKEFAFLTAAQRSLKYIHAENESSSSGD